MKTQIELLLALWNRELICDWCKKEKEKMAIFEHESGDHYLTLCFMGCQHFPEPFRDTKIEGEWYRIDPWIKKRPQPKLRKEKES